MPQGVNLIFQGRIVAESLADYLKRHPEMESRLSQGGECVYLTTESPSKFSQMASTFLGGNVMALQTELN